MMRNALGLGVAIVLATACQQGTEEVAECSTAEQLAVDSDKDGISDCQEKTIGSNPAKADTDGDGLSDNDELALKTKLDKADSDEDGVDDLKEVQCVSNPLDKAEKCYACGWFHNDPKDLVATGKTEGSVIGNMKLLDQCGETISLWDFANTPKSPTNVLASLIKGFTAPKPTYYILFMTAAW
jgi:hypothetical protein